MILQTAQFIVLNALGSQRLQAREWAKEATDPMAGAHAPIRRIDEAALTTSPVCDGYIPEKLRAWRASLLRSRAHLLGIVYAPDGKSAEAAAIAKFKIGEDMRGRLMVRPDDE